MQERRYELKPRDVLFFRDGRPMDADKAQKKDVRYIGHGAVWPRPDHLFHGVIHALLKETPGVTYGDFPSLKVIGPYPVKGGTLYLPRPLDWDMLIEPCAGTDLPKPLEYGFIDRVDGKKKAYSAGIQIAAMVKERMLPSISNDLQGSDYTIQEELFTKGFMASLKKDSTVFGQDPKPYFNTRMGAVVNAKKEAVRKAGEQFLSENSKKAGVQVTPSGLQYKILTKGKGKVPTKDDQVIVKYEGRLIDGTVFDSSYKRAEQTNKFRPTDVIKGWTEALTMMPVGSKWELYVPQELAYGARETGNIPAYSALIFIVELVGIE